MSLRPHKPRTIIAHTRPEAFVEHTQSILARLGYEIVTSEEWETRCDEASSELRRPDLRIVDERRLAEVEDEPGESPLPILLLTGRNGVTGADTRIAGAARRPVGLHDLYRLLQLVFEETPRATPRVPTHITTTCRRRGHEWQAAILSLSENGCLLRTPEPLPLGVELDLSFDLPRAGRIQVHADTAYQYMPDLGLVFSAVDPSSRDAIGGFVSDSLLG